MQKRNDEKEAVLKLEVVFPGPAETAPIPEPAPGPLDPALPVPALPLPPLRGLPWFDEPVLVFIRLSPVMELLRDDSGSSPFELGVYVSLDVTMAHDLRKSSISLVLSLREILYFFLLTTNELGIQFVSNVVLMVDVEFSDVAVMLLESTDSVSFDPNLCSIWGVPGGLVLDAATEGVPSVTSDAAELLEFCVCV